MNAGQLVYLHGVWLVYCSATATTAAANKPVFVWARVMTDKTTVATPTCS